MDISLLASEADSAAADFLSIDDLLDFSNEEFGGPIDSEVASPEEGGSPSEAEASMASSQESAPRDKSSCLQPPCVFDSDKLCVPCEDLAELEWLSTFVEESFSSGSDTTTAFCLDSSGKSAGDDDCKVQRENGKDSSQSTGPMSVLHSSFHSRDTPMSFPCRSDMSAPVRTRTKRGRTAVCFWNTQILSVEASESILESSSTASTITSDSDMINDTFYDHNDDDDYDENEDGDGEDDDDDDDDDDDIIDDILEDRMRHHSHHQHRRYPNNCTVRSKKFNKGMTSLASKKLKKFKAVVKQPDVVRKCLHCATQKTPQWRAGPMGPKTLCNACGVRYKSGRLCAEYRPASSPTFVDNLHSNSHRKVLEMRRQQGELGTNSSSFVEKPSQCGQGNPT